MFAAILHKGCFNFSAVCFFVKQKAADISGLSEETKESLEMRLDPCVQESKRTTVMCLAFVPGNLAINDAASVLYGIGSGAIMIYEQISGIVFPKSGKYWLQIKNWRFLAKTSTLLSLLESNIAIILKLFRWLSVLKKCPNTELFSICIFLNSGQIENKDQTLFKQWSLIALSQPAITCSKLTIETLEEGVKYVQS